MTENEPPAEPMRELVKERSMGALGTETAEREIRRVDVSDFEQRRTEITEQLWDAAVEVGFFQIVHHGIDLATVSEAFEWSERYFALPDHVKGAGALRVGTNAGWESRSQSRPSVRTPDQKESYQITRPAMEGLWPDQAVLPGFREAMEAFESTCHQLAMRVLSCFADKLGFERDFFDAAHDPASTNYQSTLRLLHYYATDPDGPPGLWRAGAHTDFDCLTLLFQRQGQDGLQVCPGRESDGQVWTPIEASDDAITCNIGDMLMRWSDDQLPSNFHRVKSPGPGDPHGDRYSMAFFAQANRDVVIQGPAGLHPPISAAEYLAQRVEANYRAAR